MSARPEPPAGFVAELRRRFPDVLDLRWNDLLGRWELVSMSAANRPVSQFWGWYKNPFTGERIEPDPATGLAPYRGLEPEDRAEMMKNLEESFIGNRHDGDHTWRRQFQNRILHNKQVKRASAERRAADYADIIREVDLRRPWLRYHRRERKLPS